jgi:hypothetical protein
MGNLPPNYHHHHHHHLWLLLFANTPSVIWDTLYDSPIAKFVVLTIITTSITTTERPLFFGIIIHDFCSTKTWRVEKSESNNFFIYIKLFQTITCSTKTPKGSNVFELQIYIFWKPEFYLASLLFTKHPKSLKIGKFVIILLSPKAFQIFMAFVQLKPQELKYPCTK